MYRVWCNMTHQEYCGLHHAQGAFFQFHCIVVSTRRSGLRLTNLEVPGSIHAVLYHLHFTTFIIIFILL